MLHSLYDSVSAEGEQLFAFYNHRRRWAYLFSVFTWTSTLLFIAASWAIPLLHSYELFSVYLRPIWSTVFLSAGLALIAAHRFFGWSSSFVAYRRASLRIRTLLSQSRMRWESCRSEWGDEPPTREQREVGLAICKDFVNRVADITMTEPAGRTEFAADDYKRLAQPGDTGFGPSDPRHDDQELSAMTSNLDRRADEVLGRAVRMLQQAETSLEASMADVDEINRRIESVVSETQS